VIETVAKAVIEIVPTVALAVAVGCVVKVTLTVWPPPGAKLPDPSTVKDMPMAGPALQKAAHAAINRKKS
jgi:hypothetical protein